MIIHIISDKNPPYDPFDDLVIAIIKQATDDYRSAAKMIAETGSRFEKKRLEREMKSVFFWVIGIFY